MSWSLNEVDTPALILDYDLMMANIQEMAAFFRDIDSNLRPHVKTHKCSRIAKIQIENGAIGITCAKLGEAEVMVNAGVKDILIANQIVGRQKIDRLLELARKARVAVATDNEENILDLSRAAKDADLLLDVLVEVDVGMGRCGVAPGETAVKLGHRIKTEPNLIFKGVMGYEGQAVLLKESIERQRKSAEAMRLLMDTVKMMRESGLDVSCVSAGGTGTYAYTAIYEGVTEIQAGSYVTMDTTYRDVGVPFKNALSLLATVISLPTENVAVIDTGLKSITQEFGLPEVKGLVGVKVLKLSEEHTRLYLAESNHGLSLGQKIEMIPSHGCTTINLHDSYVVRRGGLINEVWPIEARGKFQ